MAPLLKPLECSLLILDTAGDASNLGADVLAARTRISQAASLCHVPTFLVARQNPASADVPSKSPTQPVYAPPVPGSILSETPLGLALAATSRSPLLICGCWLDECVTFMALDTLGEGYDVYLIADASPPLDVAERYTAILRLVQAGIVPTATRQVVREWAAEIADASQRNRLLALV